MRFFILFALFSGAFAQQLVNLNTFTGGGQNNLIPGNAPYAIYVSAYSDSTAALQSIFVTTGDGTKKSLHDLKNYKLFQNSGQLQPFVVKDNAYLTTTLTTNDLKTLHGVMFISSTAQLNNQNFYVIDISAAQTFPKLTQGDMTFFFLNTHMNTNPYQSSIISSWTQDQSTTAYIYQGAPTDVAESNIYQIFSNPVVTTNAKTQFFSTVEKFALSLGAFYIKTTKGAPGFRIEPGYYTAQGSTTSAYTTTGFYMKAKGQTDSLYTVHCRRDTKYSGTSGMNMLGSLPTGKKVTYGVYDGASKWEESSVANPFFSPWNIPFIGENFQISSDGGNDGQYFVQYFTVQGPIGTGTTVLPGRQTTAGPGPYPTVPGHVETTTKSSDAVQIFICLMLCLVGLL
ncbi:unnamed protein product [Caenorhabditis brenneri]